LPTYDSFRFELRQSIGRFRQRNQSLATDQSYIHFGCGNQILDGFVNTDVFGNQKAQSGIDLRHPLPVESNTFEGAYAHHVVEHLFYEDAHRFFGECFRILKPKGILRIVVPDLGKFLSAYSKSGTTNEMFEWIPKHHLPKGCSTQLELIDHLARGEYFNEHRSLWDDETLLQRVSETGFSKVRIVELGSSENKMLNQLDCMTWADHSIAIEAVK